MFRHVKRCWFAPLILGAAVTACGGGAATSSAAIAPSRGTQPSAQPSPIVSPPVVAAEKPSTEEITPSPSAVVTASTICDPWLTSEAIEGVLGQAAVMSQDHQNPSVNQWPGPISCYWTLADGSQLRFTAGYDKDLHIVDPIFHGGVKIAGLGDAAEFDSVSGNEVLWGMGSDPAIIMSVATAHPGDKQLDKASLTALAHKVTIPTL